jgi:arabinogalactan endo-1,4-beta-galactosidase
MNSTYRARRTLRGLVAAACLAAFAGAAAPSIAAEPLLAGGDVSALPLLERHGAHFTDRAGHERDALSILRDAGQNIVRLRLYDDPGVGHGKDGYHWPAGSMNLPDVLVLARRSADLGMQIELTLHYSDFWTNGGMQKIPAAWQAQLDQQPDDAARFALLRKLVFERTREVMLTMKAQGTAPQFVSIGNEIEGGLLYPYGAMTEANWPRLGALLQAGYDGVKSVAPGTKVIIHLDDAGNLDKYRNYFDHLRALGVQWDLIGASYYPFWTRKSVAQLADFAKTVTARYDKDLFVMEVGFNWSPTLPNGYPGQLSDNGPYPAAMSSPKGQQQFMDEFLSTMRRTDRVLGILYWDPVMIETPGAGWAVRDADGKPGPNVVSNTTLFDFQGRALPVLDSWRQSASGK